MVCAREQMPLAHRLCHLHQGKQVRPCSPPGGTGQLACVAQDAIIGPRSSPGGTVDVYRPSQPDDEGEELWLAMKHFPAANGCDWH